MKSRHKTALASALACALLTLPAYAHQPEIPADIPPEYKNECGSCHIPYLPALLPEAEWRQVMGALDKHYGDNASLNEDTRRLIEEFLTRNAGSRFPALIGSGDPPRLSITWWHRIHHHELPDAIWKEERVGSRSNCGACHPKADKGLFDKNNLTLPPGYEHY